MFSLQLWDVSVGFVACLVLVNLFPKLSLGGAAIIKGAKAMYGWAKAKVSGA